VIPLNPHDELLKPREVAELFGVRVTTVAQWARQGRLAPVFTPGGHRRYTRQDIARLLAATDHEPAERQRLAADVVRLYEQDWSIRQLAEEFGMSYGGMRRVLHARTALRVRGGRTPCPPRSP
jgi:excisionase family DNA binding protein